MGFLLEPHLAAAVPEMETTCIQIDKKRFSVEIAHTEEQKRRGLQFRTELKPNGGMIFAYNQPSLLTFWMKDCKIPLDLLFFREGALVYYVDSAPPCQDSTGERCPTYRPKTPADTVVELKAGTRHKYKFNHQSKLSFCTKTSRTVLK
jgi:uncharacterized protein